MVGEKMDQELKVVPELAMFGYAEGDYPCVCKDCPDERRVETFTNRNEFMGAKFSTRCERHAREARVRHIEAQTKAQFNIGHAIAVMRSGSRVTRAGWNGKGQWIEIQFPDAGSKMTLPYIYMRTAQGDLVPWLASQTDILANDWHVAA